MISATEKQLFDDHNKMLQLERELRDSLEQTYEVLNTKQRKFKQTMEKIFVHNESKNVSASSSLVIQIDEELHKEIDMLKDSCASMEFQLRQLVCKREHLVAFIVMSKRLLNHVQKQDDERLSKLLPDY